MRSTQITSRTPVGVILAGGPGKRIGGNKASVALHGEPLVAHALRAMREVLSDVAIIAKPQTVLPRLDGAMVWVEPDQPTHPLLGVGEALALAGGRPVLVCPLDMPFISPRLIDALVSADAASGPAVLAASHGSAYPLVGRYMSAAGERLSQAARNQVPLEDIAGVLDARLLEVADEQELFDVDTPDDLLLAAGMLDAERRSVHA